MTTFPSSSSSFHVRYGAEETTVGVAVGGTNGSTPLVRSGPPNPPSATITPAAAATATATATTGTSSVIGSIGSTNGTNESVNDASAVASPHHIPESAARWMVGVLLESATQSRPPHIDDTNWYNIRATQLHQYFLYNLPQTPPLWTINSPDLLQQSVDSLVLRLSRVSTQSGGGGGLNDLKLPSLRFIAEKLYQFCSSEKNRITQLDYEKFKSDCANPGLTERETFAKARSWPRTTTPDPYSEVIQNLSNFKYNNKSMLVLQLALCFKIQYVNGVLQTITTDFLTPKPLAANQDMRPNDALIQKLLLRQRQNPTSATIGTTALSTTTAAATLPAQIVFPPRVLNFNAASSQVKNSASMNRKPAPVYHAAVTARLVPHEKTQLPVLLTDSMNVSYDDAPQSPCESNIVSTLREMSFGDTKEILFTYRKLLRQRHQGNKVSTSTNNGITPTASLITSKPTADEVMMEIISQREEAEEAKKMDQARVLSELSRKDEAQRRRDVIKQEFQKKMELCTDIAMLLDPNDKRLFGQSWILQDQTLRNQCQRYIFQSTMATKPNDADSTSDNRTVGTVSPIKIHFLELLQLEKNSTKWYGSILPKSYFQHYVMERLKLSLLAPTTNTNNSTPKKLNRTPKAANTPTSQRSSTSENDSTEATTIGANLLKQIRFEISSLQSNIFDLSKQVGGVPKIFRDAHDRHILSLTTSKTGNSSSAMSPTTRSKSSLLPTTRDDDPVELVTNAPLISSKKIRNPYIGRNDDNDSDVPMPPEASPSRSSPKRILQDSDPPQLFSPSKKRQKSKSLVPSNVDTSNTVSSATTTPIVIIDLC